MGEYLPAKAKTREGCKKSAAYRDSFSYPAQTILNHTLPGLELYADDYEDYFTDDML